MARVLKKKPALNVELKADDEFEGEISQDDDKIHGLSTKDIQKKGNKFNIPENMPVADAITLLERKLEEEEGRIEVVETINAFPWDGARAFAKALTQLHGTVYREKNKIETPFGTVEKVPEQISIEVDFGVTETVPWGRVSVPGITGHITTEVTLKEGFLVLAIRGNVLQKHEKDIKELADLTREILKTDSIYKGKAFSIRFLDDRGRPNKLPEPHFFDTSAPKPLVYNKTVELAISINLWTPLERSEECRKHGITLKRGILLYGMYGTGKTLAAYHAAKKARDNNWTFIYIHNGDELPQAIKVAQQYQPSIIFCEDIDSVMRGERSLSMNEVLNAIDGVESKSSEVIVVLTSNHVGDICKAMLRPGRIDAAIEVTAPDTEAAERLIRQYAGESLAPGTDLSQAAEELEGEIPAIICETVEKAKLAALSQAGPGGKLQITASSLAQAALTMRSQRTLLREPTSPNYSYEESAALLFANTMISGITSIIEKFWKK